MEVKEGILVSVETVCGCVCVCAMWMCMCIHGNVRVCVGKCMREKVNA